MKYPRLPEKLDRRKKLMKKDIVRIKLLIKKGCTKSEVARIFKVNRCTINYWVLKKCKDGCSRRNKTRYNIKIKEPKFKALKLKLTKSSQKYRKKVYLKYRQYCCELVKKSQKKQT